MNARFLMADFLIPGFLLHGYTSQFLNLLSIYQPLTFYFAGMHYLRMPAAGTAFFLYSLFDFFLFLLLNTGPAANSSKFTAITVSQKRRKKAFRAGEIRHQPIIHQTFPVGLQHNKFTEPIYS
jgi:hypothetical protein